MVNKKKFKNVMDVGDFGIMKNDSLAEHGIPRNTVVYLAGSHMAMSETNFYNYRKLFIGAQVDKEGHLMIEREDGKFGFFVDAKNLRKLKGKRLENLKKVYEQDAQKWAEEVHQE
jgi:hypothetical protein